MNSSIKKSLLSALEKEIPSIEVDLWPAVKNRLVAKNHRQIKQGEKMKNSNQRLLTGLTIGLATLVIIALVTFVSPQSRAFAQSVLHFFSQANSDTLPAQTAQPEITEAPRNLDVAEAENQAGFDVLSPSPLPDGLSFVGASYTPANSTVIQQYNFPGGSGFSISQQSYTNVEACNLCGLVGPSASVETVKIGNVDGEYVEGVWSLTDKGSVWENTPYLKTLRWQKDGMAYEIIFMGTEFEKADLISLAENLK